MRHKNKLGNNQSIVQVRIRSPRYRRKRVNAAALDDEEGRAKEDVSNGTEWKIIVARGYVLKRKVNEKDGYLADR